MAWATYPSPLGPLTLIGATAGLRHVYFPGRAPSLAPSDRDASTVAEAVGQLDEYFAASARSSSSTSRVARSGIGCGGAAAGPLWPHNHLR